MHSGGESTRTYSIYIYIYLFVFVFFLHVLNLKKESSSYSLASDEIWTVNSCSVHTYTQTHTYQSLVWADFITCIRLAPYAKIFFFSSLTPKKLCFNNSFFFCRFAKNIKPSFNAKSEKELLPERCCVVHQALMSKWLSRVTGFWSGVGSWGVGASDGMEH